MRYDFFGCGAVYRRRLLRASGEELPGIVMELVLLLEDIEAEHGLIKVDQPEELRRYAAWLASRYRPAARGSGRDVAVVDRRI